MNSSFTGRFRSHIKDHFMSTLNEMPTPLLDTGEDDSVDSGFFNERSFVLGALDFDSGDSEDLRYQDSNISPEGQQLGVRAP